jgi:hypothetical protein
MPLKNYRTRLSTDPFAVIQKTLATHKAKQITQEFGDDGRVHALTFSLEINGRPHTFRLPARVENVECLLYGKKDLTETQKEQAYKTAWANIRDWISAQMALLDTGMVKPEEIFLPYMQDRDGVTFFERMEQRGFLLGDGQAH